jgi:hypothetical protein
MDEFGLRTHYCEKFENDIDIILFENRDGLWIIDHE